MRSGFPEKKALLICLLLLGVGFCLRLWGVFRYDLWCDELVTARYSFNSVARVASSTHQDPSSILWKNIRTDIHSPPFYLIIHFLSSFVPDCKILRLFSVFCSMLALFLFWKTVSMLGTFREYGWSVLLLAMSPLHIWYAQELRGYSFFVMWTVIVLWIVLKIVSVQPRWAFLLLIIIGPIATISYLPLGIFVLTVFVMFMMKKSFVHQRHFLVAGLILCLFGVFVSYYLYDWQRLRPDFSWIPFKLDSLFWLLSVFNLGYSATVAQQILGVFLFGILGVLGARQLFRDQKEIALLLFCLFLIPIVVIWGLSVYQHSFFLMRYAFFVSPIYYVFVGRGVSLMRHKAVACGVIITMILLLSISLNNYYKGYIPARADGDDFYPGIHKKAQYMDALRFIDKGYREGDILLTSDINATLMIYSFFKEGLSDEHLLLQHQDYTMGIALYRESVEAYERFLLKFSEEKHRIFTEYASSGGPCFFLPHVFPSEEKEHVFSKPESRNISRVWLISYVWNEHGLNSVNTDSVRQFMRGRCSAVCKTDYERMRIELFSCRDNSLKMVSSPECLCD